MPSLSALNYIFSEDRLSSKRRTEGGLQNGARSVEKGIGHMLASVEADVGLPLPGPNATGDELFKLGMLYSTGQGGAPLDFISAHMLFNLAAMRGSNEGKVYRKELSHEMGAEEVAEAQRAAREWLAQG